MSESARVAGAALPGFDAVVLAGGQARRLGGVAKPDVEVANRPMLDHVLDAVAPARRVVVVGPSRLARPATPGRPAVSTVLENPPFGGPVAGLAAGLAAVSLHDEGSLVAVLACDVPRAGRALPLLLATADGDENADGARLVDAAGKPQHLLAVYRSGPLRHAVDRVDGCSGVRGASMRALVAGLRMLDLPDRNRLGLDADTWNAVGVLNRVLQEEKQ